MPEHHTRRLFLHMIQIELLTDFTVIALSGFFQTLQIGIKRFFICPGGTVDALQHFIVAIAAPVGARGLHQFEVMAETHIRHMRPTAHVDIFFVMIQAGLIIMSNVFIKNRDFIALAALHKGFTRFVPADFLLNNVVVFLGELMHAFFERVDIFLGQGMVQIDIIVETIVDNRADRHFGIWPQLFNRMPQKVRTGVTNNLKSIFIFRGDDRERCVVFN